MVSSADAGNAPPSARLTMVRTLHSKLLFVIERKPPPAS
jgi:hypothetical protein